MPNPQSAIRNPQSPRRGGGAVVELAILLPVYVVLILAVILVGYLGLAKIASVKGAFGAAEESGIQGPVAADAAWFPHVRAEPLLGTQAGISGYRETESPSGTISALLVDETLEDVARDPVGVFTFDPVTMRLEYRIDNRLSRYGRYILRNRLQDESGTVADLMDPWLKNSRAEAGYAYDLGQDFLGGLQRIALAAEAAETIRRGALERGRHPGNNPDFVQMALTFYGMTGLPRPTDEGSAFWEPN